MGLIINNVIIIAGYKVIRWVFLFAFIVISICLPSNDDLPITGKSSRTYDTPEIH